MTLLSLTQEEASSRAALIDVTRYDIDIDLTGLREGNRFSSLSTVSFRCNEPGASTFIDCAGEVTAATLNGAALDLADVRDGRLPLSEVAAENELVVAMHTDNTAMSEGILRTVDPTDDNVYVWTSFEPDDARRLWACFDQPDLKAPHRFTVTAPAEWLVTSNTAPETVEQQGQETVWTFADTPALSTYVVVVNAGPFHEVRVQHDGYDLGFYCRQSLRAALERDIDELVTLTRQGLAFFAEQFGIAFPQERYDQVFVPNLGGAMENWGCVTYGDTVLFRTPPTHMQRASRAEFILHEMAHMWFGDLVTMQWWDDLWLNEAFASWAANWGMARATEFTDQWANFLAASKRSAYEMDMSPATHPIRGTVPTVADAMANFDAITYVKGQSVLHQLMALIGEPAFVSGLRDYFSRHAWGNTVLNDLMSAFGRAAGRDLSAWTADWLDRAGTDVIALSEGTVSVTGPDGQQPRTHRIDIASYDTSGHALHEASRATLELDREARIDASAGDLHLLNAGDLTFAAVRPDPHTRSAMFERIADFVDPLDRALVVATASQLLLLGDLAPREAAAAMARALPKENSPALVEPMLSLGLAYADRWAPAEESPDLMKVFADSVMELAGQAEHRQAALRSLAASASTEAHWEFLEEALAQQTDRDLQWRTLVRRAELDDLDVDGVDRLLAEDTDPDASTRRLTVLAAHPSVESKEEVWRAFFVDYSIPASREALILGQTFWRPGQTTLLKPFAMRYLEELPTLKGGLLHQGQTIRAMYPSAVADEQFLAAADAAIADETLSAYARNQLRANGFLTTRMLAARKL